MRERQLPLLNGFNIYGYSPRNPTGSVERSMCYIKDCSRTDLAVFLGKGLNGAPLLTVFVCVLYLPGDG